MSVIIFLIILAVLVLIHELGHFSVAKAFGIRVDEFGLGFPPKIFGKKFGETTYSLNWIPFGGFVKIFGENPDDESISGLDSSRSFVNKNRGIQALVLFAGVGFNIIFAWLLISLGFMFGLPTAVDQGFSASNLTNTKLVITGVLPNTPAEKAGLKGGDSIVSLETGLYKIDNVTPDSVEKFIGEHATSDIFVSYARGEKTDTAHVTPQKGIIEGRPAIGISMSMVGILKLSFFEALWQGVVTTGNLLRDIAVGLALFIWHIVTFEADFSQVTGPVGIAGMVGDAKTLGFMYLLSFTAFISLNLAVINLIPFPALDGGRILFVAIEAVRRKMISPKISNTINTVGFALLIGLMLVVTYKDIVKLFVK